jgi:hypothetical protein
MVAGQSYNLILLRNNNNTVLIRYYYRCATLVLARTIYRRNKIIRLNYCLDLSDLK